MGREGDGEWREREKREVLVGRERYGECGETERELGGRERKKGGLVGRKGEKEGSVSG